MRFVRNRGVLYLDLAKKITTTEYPLPSNLHKYILGALLSALFIITLSELKEILNQKFIELPCKTIIRSY